MKFKLNFLSLQTKLPYRPPLSQLPVFIAVFAILNANLIGSANAQGDVYIRAQLPNGGPTGLHEILTEPKDGYYMAQYCGQTYWVSLKTVIWTEEQSAAGRILILDQNTNGTSKILCVGAADFATLEDLHLKPEKLKKLRRKP